MRQAGGQEEQPSCSVHRLHDAVALYVEHQQQATEGGCQQIVDKALFHEFHGHKGTK